MEIASLTLAQIIVVSYISNATPHADPLTQSLFYTTAMSSSFSQAFGHFPDLLYNVLHEVLRYSSAAVHVYSTAYLPLIYTAFVATELHEHEHNDFKIKALAVLTILLGCYRSLKIFFPWINSWLQHIPQIGSRPENANASKDAFLSNAEIQAVDVQFGLSDAEVARRQRKYGRNELKAGKTWFQAVTATLCRVDNLVSEVRQRYTLHMYSLLTHLACNSCGGTPIGMVDMLCSPYACSPE